MSKTLIAANPDFRREIPNEPYLNISEMFSDTIQGENFMGDPAMFIRLMDCTLNCSWCDSVSVWRYGNPYTITEVLDILEEGGTVDKLKDGQHMVLTGGSPLLQQSKLLILLDEFGKRFDFTPIVEIENECVLPPLPKLVKYISIWNNSPKLQNSGNKLRKRYKPEVIKEVSSFENSWFKFVVTCDEDWDEINETFLEPGLIKKSQIVIMPEGENREELEETRSMAADMAIKHNVKFSDRLHVILWDMKTGV